MKRFLLVLPLLTLAACFFSPVNAQQLRCNQQTEVEDRLTGNYGETRKSYGLSEIQGQFFLVETWANEETGTWTITVTGPNKITCLVSQGSNFTLSPTMTGPEGEEG